MLNLDLLNNLEDLLPNAQHDSQYYYFRTAEIKDNDSIVVRVLMPKPLHDNGNGGLFFTFMQDHWFTMPNVEKSIKITSTETYYGIDTCYVEAVKAQLAKTNPQAYALFKNEDIYTKRTTMLVPCLILENVKYDNTGAIIDYTVKNNKVCLLQVPKTVLSPITTIFTSPFRQRPSGKAIADTESGFSISITKKSVNKKVSYTVDCLPQPHAIDPVWENDVDIMNHQYKQLYSDEYIASVINQFLTGKGLMETPTYRHPELREQSNETAAPVVNIVNPIAPKVATATATTPAAANTPVTVAEVPQAVAPTEPTQPGLADFPKADAVIVPPAQTGSLLEMLNNM